MVLLSGILTSPLKPHVSRPNKMMAYSLSDRIPDYNDRLSGKITYNLLRISHWGRIEIQAFPPSWPHGNRNQSSECMDLGNVFLTSFWEDIKIICSQITKIGRETLVTSFFRKFSDSFILNIMFSN